MSLLSTLQTDARMLITEIADTNAFLDATLLTILNYAAREFMRRAEAYPTSTTFASTASTMAYLLSTYVTTFASVHKDGLFWNNGTRWIQLDSETRASLTRKFPAWRNASNGSPARYFIEGNAINVHPPSAATTAAAFELFHFARSVDGSAATKYVFTNSLTLELTYLVDFEDVLFDFVRSKVASMNNKPTLASEFMNIFYARCEEAKQKLSYRADLIRSYRPDQVGMPLMRATSDYQGRTT